MKQNYSGIWSYHQYNVQKHDKKALKFALKTKKYDLKTKSRTNAFAKSSWNEHSIFCELITSNSLSSNKFLVSFYSIWNNQLRMNMLYIAYCWLAPLIILLRFYQTQHIINNDIIFNIAETRIKCNTSIPLSIDLVLNHCKLLICLELCRVYSIL